MLPSGLPDIVAGEENLARFLRSSSYFNTTMVKPAAFLPNSKNRQTSVFRHGATPVVALVRIAQDRIPSGVTIHGAAICSAERVRSSILDVIAEEPPPLHANIVGWPVHANDPELQKAEQKERATLLASSSTLVRF